MIFRRNCGNLGYEVSETKVGNILRDAGIRLAEAVNPFEVASSVANVIVRFYELPLEGKDYGRHTGISCHVREFGDSGKTATWAGTSKEMIEEHYDGLVTGSQAKEFWSILPD